MITDTVACTIERRLLVNYRIHEDQVAPLLPPPFRPQTLHGWAVGGVCFLRLGHIRPAPLPPALGITTENVAHRFAVEWDDAEGHHTGVYVPSRNTNSRLTALAGGRLFSGDYRWAHFDIDEPGSDVRITVSSARGAVSLDVAATAAEELGGELFANMDAAMSFFRRGALGFSPAAHAGRLDAVRLQCNNWTATPMRVQHMRSRLFDDPRQFPAGTCILDSALVMRNLPVQWVAERAHSQTVLSQVA